MYDFSTADIGPSDCESDYSEPKPVLRRLDTRDSLGSATPEQIKASLAAGPDGAILVDMNDGAVLREDERSEHSLTCFVE